MILKLNYILILIILHLNSNLIQGNESKTKTEDKTIEEDTEENFKSSKNTESEASTELSKKENSQFDLDDEDTADLYHISPKEIYSGIHFQQFDVATNESYADFGKNALPRLTQLTICARVKLLHANRPATLLSYFVDGRDNELFIGLMWAEQAIKVECCQFHLQMTLYAPLKLYVWQFICLGLNLEQEEIILEVDDSVVKERLVYARPIPQGSTHLIIKDGGRLILGQDLDTMEGNFAVAKSFHGDVLDFIFYNVTISLLNMKRFKNCEVMILDDIPIYSFKEDLKNTVTLSGDTYFEDYKARKICKKEPFHPMLFPLRRTMDQSIQMCATLSGELVIPNNDKENERIYDAFAKYEGICRTNWAGFFWLGIRGNLNTRKWMNIRSDKEIRYEKLIPGFEMVNNRLQCVSAAASANKYKWLGTPCQELLCPVCNFTHWPLVRIRGICKLTNIDTMLYVHGYQNDRPVIHGAYQSIIFWGGKGWEILSRQYNEIRGKMLSKQPGEFLIGVHDWEVEGDQCGSKKLKLLITSCSDEQFSCADGTCVPKSARCNYKTDCIDLSDESHCDILEQSKGYSASLPPPSKDDSPISVLTKFQSTSVRKFDLVGFSVTIDVIETLIWTDSRLEYKNLRESYLTNNIKSFESVWVPKLHFEDGTGSPSKIEIMSKNLLVQREGKPLPDDISRIEEDDVYYGGDNPLDLLSKYSITFSCLFHLQYYPFDTQHCGYLIRSQDMADVVSILLDGDGFYYEGERNLLEYELYHENITIVDENVFRINLDFRNLYGYYIGNAFLPSALMIVISYLVYFYDIEDFEDRIMVSLTSLLVLASLFSQSSISIPKTAYLKLIDVWYVFLISFDFIIIVNLVLIEILRMSERIPSLMKINPMGTTEMKPKRFTITRKAHKCNLLGAILFPIIAIGFFMAFFWIGFTNLWADYFAKLGY